MRRIVGVALLIVLAVVLLLVLRQRKRAFIAAQVELLQSDDPQEATAARKRLQRIGRSAVCPVCALLEHEDEEVRARAALTLANIGHAAACGPLTEAAKRGELPAADALAVMKHPEAREARAWAFCRLGDEAVDELRRRLPIGGGPPTAPCALRSPPRRPFQPVPRKQSAWPGRGWSLFSLATFARAGEQEASVAVVFQQPSVQGWYDRSLEVHPLPQAFIGLGRLQELRGDYARAAESYAAASELASGNETAREGRRRTERLAALAREMAALLQSGHRIDRILSHPSWSEGDTTHYVASTRGSYGPLRLVKGSGGIDLFRERRGRLEHLGVVPAFPTRQRRWAGMAAYVGVVALDKGERAVLAVVVETQPIPDRYDYHLGLHALRDGRLVKTLELASVGLPSVTDLDDDGDAELITWRWAVHYPISMARSVLWPIVRARVGDRYEVRTEQFPSLFEPVARELRLFELGYAPGDPKVSERLGRAYEILGETAEAIAAYERAERKYEEASQQQSAASVRERRLRLEAEREDTPQQQPRQTR